MTTACDVTPLDAATRKRLFDIIFAKTHSDMKGSIGGQKSIVSYAKFGGGLASLATISDAELRERHHDTKRPKT